MNRPCYALAVLFATLTASLLAVSTSHGQCWMDGRIGPPNRGLCPVDLGSLTDFGTCYVIRPVESANTFRSEYDTIHDEAVYGGEVVEAKEAVAEQIVVNDDAALAVTSDVADEKTTEDNKLADNDGYSEYADEYYYYGENELSDASSDVESTDSVAIGEYYDYDEYYSEAESNDNSSDVEPAEPRVASSASDSYDESWLNHLQADVEVADVEVADVEVADVEVADVEVADVEVADVEVADVEVADVEVADVEVAENYDDYGYYGNYEYYGDYGGDDADYANSDDAPASATPVAEVADSEVADSEVADSDSLNQYADPESYDYYGDLWASETYGVPVEESTPEATAPAVVVGEDPAKEDYENWAEAAGVTANTEAVVAPVVTTEAESDVVENELDASDYTSRPQELWTSDDFYNYFSQCPKLTEKIEVSAASVDVVTASATTLRAARNVVISPYQLSELDCIMFDVTEALPSLVRQHAVTQGVVQEYRRLQEELVVQTGAFRPHQMGRSVLRGVAFGLQHASESLDSVSKVLTDLAGPDSQVGGRETQRR
jgi:hypothetical protein